MLTIKDVANQQLTQGRLVSRFTSLTLGQRRHMNADISSLNWILNKGPEFDVRKMRFYRTDCFLAAKTLRTRISTFSQKSTPLGCKTW